MGDASRMPDAQQLLRTHQPVLLYDSQETYFSDAADSWTANPANVLRRAGGQVLARATPRTPGEPALSLDFLGQFHYRDGRPVLGDDEIADPAHDYVEQARVMHGRFGNLVYGRAHPDGNDRLWLQYWRWHFYNDFALAGIHAGVHEGDWEMVQLRLRPDGTTPDLAVYAQHSGGEARRWDRVAKEGSRPVVYIARGSHASYFSRETLGVGSWLDRADGRRRARNGERLQIVGDRVPEWLLWPGYWGGTRPAGFVLDARSPRGPAAHRQWRDPLALVALADEQARRPAIAPMAPAAPTFVPHRVDDRLLVDYDLGHPNLRGPGTVTALVVTVNPPDDRTMPPRTWALPVTGQRGTVSLPVALDPAQRYEVVVSTAAESGAASEAVDAMLPAAE
jgi:hypothetical protein